MSESVAFTNNVRFCSIFKDSIIEVTPCHVHFYSEITNMIMRESLVDDTMSWYGVIMARKKTLWTKRPP